MPDLNEIIKSALAKKYDDELFAHSFDPTDFISTGVPSIDYVLGRPGIACGRLTTVKGPMGSGKSALVHAMIAQCQRRGGTAVLLETENAVDLGRMSQLGVDVAALEPLIFQPSHVEEALNLIGDVILTVREQEPNGLVLVAWDSVAATPTKKEIEGESGDASMGMHARLLSQGLRKYTGLIAKHRIALVLVNQVREKIGGMPFADNSVMIADKPISYHSTTILDVRRTGTIKDKSAYDPTGISMEVRVQKQKLAPPYRKAEVRLDFGTGGFEVLAAWLDIAVQVEVVTKNGSWYVYGDQKFQAKTWEKVTQETDVLDRVRAAAFPAERPLATAVA